MNRSANVAIFKGKKSEYPKKDDQYRPSILYPEYPFDKQEISSKANEIYDSVREAYHMMELDSRHWGMPEWNPLGDIIVPGNTVLIKPNLVKESNDIKENGTDCLYTHPSVVAAVIDYVVIALKGNGKIIVGDAPIQNCRWEMLICQSGYKKLIEWYKAHSIDIELIDLRELTSEVKNGLYVQSVNPCARGKVINLEKDSDFTGILKESYSHLRITNYDPTVLLKHHNDDKHEYYVSEYMLLADVIINMPKPKTHRKAGITGALKNFVGINIRKEYLPHHTMGSVEEGGDEYDKRSWIHSMRSNIWDKRNRASANGRYVEAYLLKWISGCLTLLLIAKGNRYSEGSWYGNKTISHTVVDLNRIVLYADKAGIMRNIPQRKIFVVADLIISGEKDGPIAPTPKKIGIIAMGDDPLYFDEVLATIMGFDINKIPTIIHAKQSTGKYRIIDNTDEGVIRSNIERFNNKRISQISYEDSFKFEAAPGWAGHIESI